METHDWKDLQMVSAVRRHGSLSGAARELGVVPSTLHRRVTAFEERLGVALFERKRSGYTLTEAGAYVLDALEPMELAMAELHRRALHRRDEAVQVITLTAPALLATRICAWIPELFSLHPNLRLVISSSERIEDLARGASDIAVRVSNTPDESLWGQRLGFVDFVVAGQRAYVEELGDAWAERAMWVVYDDSLRDTLQYRWERAQTPASRRVLETSCRHVHLEAMRQGCGLGLVPTLTVASEDALCAVTEPLPHTRVGLWLLTHHSLKDSRGVRQIMDFLSVRGRAALDQSASA